MDGEGKKVGRKKRQEVLPLILRSHDSFGNEVTLTDERRVSEKRGGTLMDGEGKKVGRKKWILGFALTALVLDR